MHQRTIRGLAAAILLFTLITFPRTVRANHGPGASGGGSATISGETLKPGSFELSLREDFSDFESFSRARATQRALKGGDFDALDHGFITTGELAYGIIENLQISIGLGYFVGHDFLSAEREEDNSVTIAHAKPSGLTDLPLILKYRFLQGKPGNLAGVAGVKFPTGRNNVHLANGGLLSPTDEPGTGAFDYLFGLGYSRFLTSHLTMDASFFYTFRSRHDDFRVGDRFDVGLAFAYRITESVKTFPQYSVFGELNDVHLGRDTQGNEQNPNSGSNTLYFTPGARIRFSPLVSLTVAPSFPIVQDLHGNQGEVRFKLAVTLSFSF